MISKAGRKFGGYTLPILLPVTMALLGCASDPVISEHYPDQALILRPGLNDPGRLVAMGFPEWQLRISFPENWIFTRTSDRSERYGDSVYLESRGPVDSMSGYGYTVLQLWVARTVENGGRIADFRTLVHERDLEHRDGPEDPHTAARPLDVASQHALQFFLRGWKAVPPHGADMRKVVTATTYTLMERRGYLYEVSLYGSEVDHDRFKGLYDAVLNSMAFDG